MKAADANRAQRAIDEVAAAWVFRRSVGLSDEEAAELQSWQAADGRHRAALARHEQAWAVLERPRRSGQAGMLLERLSRRAARRRQAWVGLTAAVALAAVVVSWRAPTETALPESRLVRPEQRQLADGSVVELRAAAEISVDYTGEWRRVTLRHGEAHFQVAHQERPFVVTAAGIDFRAVGTAFAVQCGRQQVDLLVTQGRVAVQAPIAPPISSAMADNPRIGELASVAAGSQETTFVNRCGATLVLLLSVTARIRFWGGGW